MATGTDQQTDKGFTPLWQVILVQVVGVVSLIALGGLIGACAGRWNGRRAQTLRWAALAFVIWLLWAVLRIGEYAS